MVGLDGSQMAAHSPVPYAVARARHAVARAVAYEIAREDAIRRRICGPELRMADIDRTTLEVWQETWTGVHTSGAGGWDWVRLVDGLPHRAAVFPLAIWYGSDLCGLAIGYASRSRAARVRHTITLTFAERRPEPPAVPLRGYIVSIAAAAARAYGLALGARRLRLRNPDRRLLQFYQRLGFRIAWKNGHPVYCEVEI